jgi:D-alanyl-D-alanine dipeptidase
MGACFDFFGELSHFDAGADQIGEKALLNRQILREAMEQFGFISSDIEFWHFSLGGNHTGLAFDEPISPKLKA